MIYLTTLSLFLSLTAIVICGYILNEQRLRKRVAGVVSETKSVLPTAKPLTKAPARTPTPAPPTASEVAEAVANYVRYDDRITWEEVQHIVEQPGADVRSQQGIWFWTPLMKAAMQYEAALSAKIDGSREPKKILHVIRLLLDHGADPRMFDNNGETVRGALETRREFQELRSGYVADPILEQVIEMLREGEDVMQAQEDRTALIGSMGGIEPTDQAQPRKL